MEADTYVYDDQIRPIQEIDFAILGNEEIRHMSAFGKDTVGVEVADLYDNLEPKSGGLIDLKMGPNDSLSDCATCGLNNNSCVGHFGHIVLEEHVFNMGYLPIVKKLLGCVCLMCSKLLVYKNEEEWKEMLKNKSAKNRLTEIKNLTKNVSYCQKQYDGCGTPVPKIKTEIKPKSMSINIIAETNLVSLEDVEGAVDGKKKVRQILTPNDCYNILRNISDEDSLILGIDPKKSRPEMMIHKIFPVPPVSVRPSAKVEFLSSSTKEDDLTHKLADIMKSNLRLKKFKEKKNEKNAKYGADHFHLLQYHVATYFDNESIDLPKSEQKGKTIKSLASRLKGKEGRVRGNLMGKRVNFSARTVITPDPSLDFNELGVPVKIAQNITFPEIVTTENIKKLTQLVKNGRDTYPGANYVFPLSQATHGKRIFPIDLRFRKEKIELNLGDIVERHIITGDIGLLNRQPTLHKLSMMGHRIRVLNDTRLSTFRLNLAIVTGYNADFDGDEMNCFAPQSVQSQIELEEIANAQLQIITPQSSTPIVGIVQDGLLGSYNLTRDSTEIDWRSTMNLLAYTDINNFGDIKKDKFYKGKEIFSKILPNKINVEKAGVKIKNGQLLKGQINKKFLKPGSADSLIGLIWDQYGVKETKSFIDNVQRLINIYNLYNGFTVGIGDTYITPEFDNDINTKYETEKLEIRHMITEVENNPDLFDIELFEKEIGAKVNKIRSDHSVAVMDNLDPMNNFNIMINSGSKGKGLNMAQMVTGVGQQDVEGARIRKKLNGRSLHYFHQNDDTAEARGLVQKSFLKGSDPHEFIFYNMSAREGIIDTAIKTAESGYIQRRFIKAMEDATVKYDGTVRNARNLILQYIYGSNGLDPTRQKIHKLKAVYMGNSEIEQKYKFNSQELKSFNINTKLNNDHYLNIIKTRDVVRQAIRKSLFDYRTINDSFMLPVNLERIIRNSINNPENGKSKLTDEYIINEIQRVLKYENSPLVYLNKQEQKDKSLKLEDDKISKTIFKFSLYEYLSPKKCLIEYNFNKETFDNIITNIIKSFTKCTVQPGEMVGIVAAQSIGEPVTQMTLNTFHMAGISAMGTSTLGVPRMKEILSISGNMKTPKMEIYLNQKYKNNDKMVNKISSHILYTTLEDIRESIEVIFEPNMFDKNSYMINDNVHNIFYSQKSGKNSCKGDINSMPWLVRIKLNREKMMNKDIRLLDIKSKFCSHWEKRSQELKSVKKEDRVLLEKISQVAILSNSESEQTPYVHVRFDMTEFDYNVITSFINNIIEKFKLKGLNNIDNTDILFNDQEIVFNPDNGNVETKTQHLIFTSGVNMLDIRYLNGIDLNKTITNDIKQVYEIFGIEAARNILIKEMKYTFAASDNNFNFQHMSILVDIMTHNGSLVSIDRHGMNKIDTDPLSRASFEKTTEQFFNAAVYGETDHMRSVSARIMAGLSIKGGTGLPNILLDFDQLENSEYIEQNNSDMKFTQNAIINDIIHEEENENTENDNMGFMPL